MINEQPVHLAWLPVKVDPVTAAGLSVCTPPPLAFPAPAESTVLLVNVEPVRVRSPLTKAAPPLLLEELFWKEVSVIITKTVSIFG